MVSILTEVICPAPRDMSVSVHGKRWPDRPAPRCFLPLRLRRQPIPVGTPLHVTVPQVNPAGVINPCQVCVRIIAGLSPPSPTAHCTTSLRRTNLYSEPDGWSPCPSPDCRRYIRWPPHAIDAQPELVSDVELVYLERAHRDLCWVASRSPSKASPIVKLPVVMDTMLLMEGPT